MILIVWSVRRISVIGQRAGMFYKNGKEGSSDGMMTREIELKGVEKGFR